MKQLSIIFALLLLSLAASADIYQDPETKVNYEYTPGEREASVKAGTYSSGAGSPDATGDITILSSFTVDGNEYSVTSIGDRAFLGCSGLTSVTIPNFVTSIENYAFCQCSGLTAITIPNSVTSIGVNTFAGCSGLTSVTIPNSVTSIGDVAFYNCSGLTSIVVESGNAVYDSRNNCNAIIKTETNELIIGCKKTIIPNSVTSIGRYAFGGCSGLTSVTIPNSVTSIGSSVFAYCSGLTELKVEGGNTVYDSRNNCNAVIKTETNELIVGCMGTVIPNSVTSIGNDAFAYCSGLTSITIPNSVTSIGNYAFYRCSGLTSITIPNSVTSIGGAAFSGCSGLTSVTIPNSVTSIGEWAFYDCSGLTSVTIGNSLTSIGYGTFSGCSGLTSFTIPNSVTSIGQEAFSGCSSLTSITIPNSVTSIGYGAFAGCSGLTSISIPNSLTSIGNHAFQFCSGLTEVRSYITEPFSVYCWYDVNKDIPLYVPIGTKKKYQATEGWNYFTNIIEMEDEGPTGNIAFADDNVKAICVANWDTDGDGELSYKEAAAVTDIGTVFWGNKDITSFDELQYFTEITELSEGAFGNCSSLTSITIPKSVTNIGRLLLIGCENLKSIRVDEENPSYDSRDNCNAIIETASNRLVSGCMNTVIPNSVESIGDSSFEGHPGLLSITIPNSVKAIEFGAFNSCRGLSSITIPKSVTYIGVAAFANCSGLKTIQVENGNTEYDSRNDCNAIISTNGNALIAGCMSTVIPNTVTSIESFAFCGCIGLISLDIPNSVISIGYVAFSDCSNLSSVTIPNSVTTIGDAAFQVCSSLTTLEIPNSVTTIGRTAFTCCTSLSSITIPESVTNIGDGAFSCCESMEKVFSHIKEPFEISSDAFSTGWQKNTATLYVPVGCKGIYENTAGWNTFANIVETDGLEPDDSGEKDFAEGGDITEDTDLSGVVVDNMFYNIGTDAGGYNSEEGCIVITKETSDEQMELLQGLGISDEELQKNFTGIIFKVPAGEGTVKVTAETTGNMTLKVKVGNGKAMKMELSGKLKMEFPYDVNEESLVYIFAGTTDESGIRGAAATEPSSLKIYGIEWSSSSPKGDVNGDGKVNVGDIMAVINIMADGGKDMKGDVNGDGAVNVGDIMAVINIMASK